MLLFLQVNALLSPSDLTRLRTTYFVEQQSDKILATYLFHYYIFQGDFSE